MSADNDNPRHAISETEDDKRRRAIVETTGTLTGVFGTGYLEQLREDWP